MTIQGTGEAPFAPVWSASPATAPLMLLDANPIDDVANLDKIAAVVLKGRYFSKAALDKLKSDVASAYERLPLGDISTVSDSNHVDPHCGRIAK